MRLVQPLILGLLHVANETVKIALKNNLMLIFDSIYLLFAFFKQNR